MHPPQNTPTLKQILEEYPQLEKGGNQQNTNCKSIWAEKDLLEFAGGDISKVFR